MIRRSERTSAGKQLAHLPVELCKGLLRRGGPRHEYVQAAAHTFQKRAHAFAQTALGAVAHHGHPHLFAHRKAHALLPVFHIQQRQIPGGYPLAPAVDIAELPVGAQTVLPLHELAIVLSGLRAFGRYRKSPYPLHPISEMGRALPNHAYEAVRRDQALSTLRPRRRRAASTRRPFLVDIRARKPCTLLRWRFLG